MPARTFVRTRLDITRVGDDETLSGVTAEGSWLAATTQSTTALARVYGKSSLVGSPGAYEFMVRTRDTVVSTFGTASNIRHNGDPHYSSLYGGEQVFHNAPGAFAARKTESNELILYWSIPGADANAAPEEQLVTVPGLDSPLLEMHVALYAGPDVGADLGATAEIVVRSIDADGNPVGVSEVAYKEGTWFQFTGASPPVDLVLVPPPLPPVTMGRHTASHGLVSCHALEVHRRVLLSNDSDATDASYQDSANKATFEVSDGSRGGRGHSGFMSAYHNGTRPQVELTGDVTFAADSTITLPRGLFHENANGSGSTGLDVSQLLSTISELTATVNGLNDRLGVQEDAIEALGDPATIVSDINELKSRDPVYVNFKWRYNRTGIIYEDDNIQFKWDGSNLQLMFLASAIGSDYISAGVSIWRNDVVLRETSYISSGGSEGFKYFTGPIGQDHNPDFDLVYSHSRTLYYLTRYYNYDNEPFPNYEITVYNGYAYANRLFSIRRIDASDLSV